MRALLAASAAFILTAALTGCNREAADTASENVSAVEQSASDSRGAQPNEPVGKSVYQRDESAVPSSQPASGPQPADKFANALAGEKSESKLAATDAPLTAASQPASQPGGSITRELSARIASPTPAANRPTRDPRSYDSYRNPTLAKGSGESAADGLASKDRGVAPAAPADPASLESIVPEGEGLKGPGFGSETGLPNFQLAEREFNTEAYDEIVENEFLTVKNEPLSTFSIDVDTASYANLRRFLMNGSLPPAGAVRIEELVNYFPYNYEPPTDDRPFAVHVEVAGCPWNSQHRLARIAIKGKEVALDKRPLSNLVFLLDVSGSMQDENKLPYVKESMRLLLSQLGENDRVAIVVYAGAAGKVLDSTPADRKEIIESAIDNLAAGGSTNGAQGIRLAYDLATKNFIKGGTNRVLLCTDGDFNVGTTSESELTDLITEKAKTGVFLSVLGFGMGNYKDSTMEKLADKGNGNYAYIDTLPEARKVLVEQMAGTLLTIAKDVKIQVDFNPAQVAAYRLIGYENRKLANEDFRDDKKDAGEIGAGHTVTALYELIPPGQQVPEDSTNAEPSKYQTRPEPTKAADSDELLTVRLRYKQPDADKSVEMQVPVKDDGQQFAKASKDFQFAAAVAEFGQLLRKSKHIPDASWAGVREIAASSQGEDPQGYRKEFLTLVERAAGLSTPVESAQR